MRDVRDVQLGIEERVAPDGSRLVALRGELDLATASMVERRLHELSRFCASIQLDLSELEFIDCAGMRILIRAQAAAAADGWDFAIGGELASPVRRMFELIADDLLPSAAGRGGGGARRTL